VAKRTSVLFKAQQNTLGRLNGHIEESISGLQVVKAFNHEQKVIDEFDSINSQLFSVGLKAQITSGYLMPLMNIISNISFAVIAGVGGVLAVESLITVGVIASFLSYSKQFSRPLNDVANMFNTLQTAMAGAERFFEVIDSQGEPADKNDAAELIKPRGEVEFRHVDFEYRKGVPILRDISFKAEAGSTIALVGPTGAGKTTVVNLVNRFYDVTGGQIFIDGADINDYTRESLRRCFGIVLQDTYLFSGTIAENIRYGRLDATDEEVRRAAAEACADPFIRKLEKGYDTVLSESGGNLSQGQRQLLAIARAILADPSILILDEATSSVDTRTEMNIQQAMVGLMSGRTCFIIAHRLSTIRGADIIMVIDSGKIVESGSHESLIEQKGFYYNLYTSQFNNVET
jgi:ATP-binding cassette subfamily B protein